MFRPLLLALLLVSCTPPPAPRGGDTATRINMPATTVAGITFVGKMVLFTHPEAPEVDSFVVELPDTTRAFCALIVSGTPLPIPTARRLRVPPWQPGVGVPTPTGPGIAWRSFMYHADTLVAWGYDVGDSQYVGRLEMRTKIKVRQDSNAVFTGYWETYGAAVPIPVIAKKPAIRELRQKYVKLIDQYALRLTEE